MLELVVREFEQQVRLEAGTEARAFAGATVPTGTAPARRTWAEVGVRELEEAGITLACKHITMSWNLRAWLFAIQSSILAV
jgi:hypothetical protein